MANDGSGFLRVSPARLDTKRHRHDLVITRRACPGGPNKAGTKRLKAIHTPLRDNGKHKRQQATAYKKNQYTGRGKCRNSRYRAEPVSGPRFSGMAHSSVQSHSAVAPCENGSGTLSFPNKKRKARAVLNSRPTRRTTALRDRGQITTFLRDLQMIFERKRSGEEPDRGRKDSALCF
jgi:hypothetical protein